MDAGDVAVRPRGCRYLLFLLTFFVPKYLSWCWTRLGTTIEMNHMAMVEDGGLFVVLVKIHEHVEE